MKKLIFTLFLIFGYLTFSKAQTNLNDYKYVIVPNKFEFLKGADKYQLNSLTKFLFNKYGFEAVLENEMFPEDLNYNRCLALQSDVKKVNSFLKTKLVVILKNCRNEIVFTSREGETKEKEFKKAYQTALRDAFKSFETLSYNYKPNDNIVVKNSKPLTVTKQEIEKLKEEIKTLKKEKEAKVEAIAKTEKKVIIPEKEIIKLPFKSESTKTIIEKKSNVLYAQVIERGFKIVDSTPKVVVILLTTPKHDVFIVKDKSAIVYKEDGFWYLYENNGAATTTKKLNIKF